MKKILKRTALVVLIVITAGGMALVLNHNKAKSEAKAKSVAVRPFAVSTATVGTQEISEKLSLVGTIIASREVAVASETAGKILSASIDVGDYKSAGTVLLKVDDELRQNAVTIAEVNYEKAQRDLERLEMAQTENAIPDQHIDNARHAVKSAESNLVTVRRQLKDTRIVSPISGSVVAKFVEVGGMVQPGMVIATLVDISSLKVKLNVAESDVFRLRTGDPVSVTTDVYPGVTFSGRITSISAKGDEAHTYPVEVTIPNTHEHPLKAGMFGRVSFDGLGTRMATMIPRAAIVGSVKQPQVYVVNKGMALIRDIMTGVERGTDIEVLRGLKEGDKVIVSGQNNLRDSMNVEVIK